MSLIESLKKEIMIYIFIINGKKPWSYGYHSYKWTTIKKYLDEGLFNNGNLITNYGFRIDERIIEYPWLFSRLTKDNGVLLDAGSTLNFELILNQPSLQSKKIFISTLAPEGNCYWSRGVSYIFEDLRNCCYQDNFFDWVACISTAEHIGLDNTLLYTHDISKKEKNPNSYLTAIKEFHRVLKPGGILYLTLPFGRKQNRRWFQVFDSKMIDEIITTFNPYLVIENHFRYQPTGWEKSSRELSKDATCFDIHQQKEYDPDFAAFSRGIICLEMKK
jgi:SAM-dependent methyltransferase